jgi:hypothetical protein
MLSHFGALKIHNKLVVHDDPLFYLKIQFGPIDSSAQLTVSTTNVMLLTCHLMFLVSFHGPIIVESRDAVTGSKNLLCSLASVAVQDAYGF